MALYPPSSEVLKPLINIGNQYISQGLDKVDIEKNAYITSISNVLSDLNIGSFSEINIDIFSIFVIIVMCLLALLGFIGLLIALVKIFGRKKVVYPQIPQYNLLNNQLTSYRNPDQNYLVSGQNTSNQFPINQHSPSPNQVYGYTSPNNAVSQQQYTSGKFLNPQHQNQSDQ